MRKKSKMTKITEYVIQKYYVDGKWLYYQNGKKIENFLG